MGRNIPPHQKFGQTSPAVVAEWLRRLTRNQFPSGSAGSNPADCEIFWSKNLHRPGIEPGPPAWQASILPLNQRCSQVRVNQNQDTVLPEPTHPAVVAEWLRRLTRNEFPSGSVGSNPTNCDTFGKTERKQLAPGEARTHNPGISFVLSISTVR